MSATRPWRTPGDYGESIFPHKTPTPISPESQPIPITIVTGFLGAGKTTLILNLISQLPAHYRVSIIKNEFGDVQVDSALIAQSSSSNPSAAKPASSANESSQQSQGAAISGIRELANGCVCCNLVGQMGDALEELRKTTSPDRIIIETSGSALPATLVLEINRILSAHSTGRFVLDGVISVIDTENWSGYTDTSPTAKLQAKFTDLIVLNKWEQAGERRVDDCLDFIYELDPAAPITRSDQGFVSKDLLLGLDSRLSQQEQFALNIINKDGGHGHSQPHQPHDRIKEQGNQHNHREIQHNDEVDIVSVTIGASDQVRCVEGDGLDLIAFHSFLNEAPRQEIYRIKAILRTRYIPDLEGNSEPEEPPEIDPADLEDGKLRVYALNWAFGRWRYTLLPSSNHQSEQHQQQDHFSSPDKEKTGGAAETMEPVLRMTVLTAPGDGRRWKKLLEEGDYLAVSDDSEGWNVDVRGVVY